MWILFIAIAAIHNAVMDTLVHHFTRSVFGHKNWAFWWPEHSWKAAKKMFGYKLDAWHLCKSIMIVAFCFAVVFYQPIFNWWLDIALAGVVWNGCFNLFYNKILVKK